jgi:hypothetical protein
MSLRALHTEQQSGKQCHDEHFDFGHVSASWTALAMQ